MTDQIQAFGQTGKKGPRKAFKIPKVLTKEEVQKLFGAIDTFHELAFVKTIYYCGLRISEALSLTKKDIDMKTNTLKVVQGKGNKDRLIPIPKPLRDSLSQVLQRYKEADDIVFPFNERTARRRISLAGQKAYIGHVKPHTLRHSYGTHVYESTHNIRLVQNLLGHSNIATTQIYTHISTEEKRIGVDAVFK